MKRFSFLLISITIAMYAFGMRAIDDAITAWDAQPPITVPRRNPVVLKKKVLH
ncbi:MAG: hypothetical protein KGI60_02245 [Patescibacteria group bacterium]|nr:hypothetical protein [Patescibacteria group bacterium]